MIEQNGDGKSEGATPTGSSRKKTTVLSLGSVITLACGSRCCNGLLSQVITHHNGLEKE